MFENLNAWEFGALLLLALLIFGERLPKVITDGMRMLRNLRAMATNATGDLSRELGTDIKLEDLNPKTFMRKHLLSEEDEAALRRPLQNLYEDVKTDASSIKDAVDLNTPVEAPAQRPAEPHARGGLASVPPGSTTPTAVSPPLAAAPAEARSYDDMT